MKNESNVLSMWGTPGNPYWGGGNNINTSMFGGNGFLGNQGSWQYKPFRTMDIGSPNPNVPKWAGNIMKDNRFMSGI